MVRLTHTSDTSVASPRRARRAPAQRAPAELREGLDVRADFPALHQLVHGQPLAYLDSAAMALTPECVIESMSHYYRTSSANVHRGVHALSELATAAYEGARERVRQHLNASSTSEIVFTRGTTEAINLVASSLREGGMIGEGDEILISGMEHHANIVPWQFVRDRAGAVLKVVPVTDDGDIDREAFRAALSDRTKLVAFTAVSNVLGTVNPVAALTAEAHEAGALVLVDAAQAVPTQPVDVQDWDCDFLAFSGHKVFGPTGIGVLYGRERLLESMPPYQGGGDMIRSVSFERTTFNALPWKFEAGTGPIAEAIGLARALRYVETIGWEPLIAHESRLLDAAVRGLGALEGVRVVGSPKERRSVVSFVVDKVHPHDLATMLDLKGVAVRAGHHCAQPLMKRYGVPATTRASFSVYNTARDVDRLLEGVKVAREVFA